jgi:hypothetical protein
MPKGKTKALSSSSLLLVVVKMFPSIAQASVRSVLTQVTSSRLGFSSVFVTTYPRVEYPSGGCGNQIHPFPFCRPPQVQLFQTSRKSTGFFKAGSNDGVLKECFDLLGDRGELSSASSPLTGPLTAAPSATPRDSPANFLGVSSKARVLGDDDGGGGRKMCAGQVSGSLFDLLGDGGESSSASSPLPAPLTAAPFAAPRDNPANCLGVSSEARGLGDDDAGRDGKMCAGQVSNSFFDLLGDDGKSSFGSSPLTAAPSAAHGDSPADVLGDPSIGRV